MNLIEKTIFVNSHSKEVIVEIAIYKAEVGYYILRRKNATVTGVIRIDLNDTIDYYNTELNETKKGLQKMEIIYEIRN